MNTSVGSQVQGCVEPGEHVAVWSQAHDCVEPGEHLAVWPPSNTQVLQLKKWQKYVGQSPSVTFSPSYCFCLFFVVVVFPI